LAAEKSVPEDVMSAIHSVVHIYARYTDFQSGGSGFVIKSDQETTLIATNDHVLEGER
jgi:S1-C subfamily serine protease